MAFGRNAILQAYSSAARHAFLFSSLPVLAFSQALPGRARSLSIHNSFPYLSITHNNWTVVKSYATMKQTP